MAFYTQALARRLPRRPGSGSSSRLSVSCAGAGGLEEQAEGRRVDMVARFLGPWRPCLQPLFRKASSRMAIFSSLGQVCWLVRVPHASCGWASLHEPGGRMCDKGALYSVYTRYGRRGVPKLGSPAVQSPVLDTSGRKSSTAHSIRFLPSSAFRYRAVLRPRSCLATRGPITLSFRTLLMVSW